MHTILIRWAGDRQELVRKIGRVAIRVGRKYDASTIYQGFTQHSPGTTAHVWLIGGGRIAEVRLIFDDPVMATYLSVQSVDSETAKRVMGWFAEKVEKIPVAEELADVKQNGGRDPQSYVRLALASGGDYLESVRAVLSESLHSGELSRRRGAALAIGLLLWPESLSNIMAALNVETDEATRALLTVAYRQLGAGPESEAFLQPGIQ